MALCEICHHLLDITKSVKNSLKEQGITGEQDKKAKKADPKKINQLINVFANDGTVDPQQILSLALDKETLISALKASESYATLDKKKKLLDIINQSYEASSPGDTKEKKETKQSDESPPDGKNACYYICHSCGFTTPIPPGSQIYYKNYGATSDDQFIDYTNYKFDNTLPRTKRYECPNKGCESHKDIEKKEAVMVKNSNYQIVYVCCVCDKYWLSG